MRRVKLAFLDKFLVLLDICRFADKGRLWEQFSTTGADIVLSSFLGLAAEGTLGRSENVLNFL